MGAQVVATGVGPGVGSSAALRSVLPTLHCGLRSADLGLAPTGSCLLPLPNLRQLLGIGDVESVLSSEEWAIARIR